MAKYNRKRTYRPRRKMMRRVKRSLNLRAPRPSIMSVKRTCWYGTWTPNTVNASGFWRYVSCYASNIYNFAEYAALFDQYRINGIKLTLRPKYDSFAGNDTTDTTLPGVTNQGGCLVHVINDPESNLTPSGLYVSSTLQSFFEQGNVRTYSGNRAIDIYFKPRIDNSIASGTQRIRCPWLQTKDNSVLLNGVHVFLQDPQFTGTFGQSFDLYLTFYAQFRGMN